MNIRIMILASVLMSACASQRSAYVPTVPESAIKRVEEQPLPPDPAEEPIPDEIPKGDWVVALDKGECLDENGVPENSATRPCPADSGIAVSEERAYRDGLYRLRYKELRKNYTADKQVWGVHRELYEERLKLSHKAIQDLQPSWWDRNKLSVGVVLGIVTGVATSVAILTVTEAVRDRQ